MSDLNIKLVEATKLNLVPGDVLMVTVKNNDIDLSSLDDLQKYLRGLFPNNQVFAMSVGEDGDVKFAVAKGTPQSYCSDCDCGKKERVEGKV